jgi:hypothetical protein
MAIPFLFTTTDTTTTEPAGERENADQCADEWTLDTDNTLLPMRPQARNPKTMLYLRRLLDIRAAERNIWLSYEGPSPKAGDLVFCPRQRKKCEHAATGTEQRSWATELVRSEEKDHDTELIQVMNEDKAEVKIRPPYEGPWVKAGEGCFACADHLLQVPITSPRSVI